MNYFLINLLMALLWASLQSFRPLDLIGGFVLSYGLIWFTQRWLGQEARRYVRRMPVFLMFLGYYVWDLIVATWDTTRTLFRDQRKIKPGILAYEMQAKTEFEIVMLNSLIAISPGTIGVDISADRRILYIHFVDVPDPETAKRRLYETLERHLLEVLR